MADYQPKSYGTGDQYTAQDATAVSQELEEQETVDAAQDALLAALFPVEKLTAGFCVPHRLVPHTNVTMVSGRIQLDYFTAPESASRNSIVQYAGSTAAGQSPAPTMIKFGVYSVDPATSNLTRIAVTANDTSLYTAAFGQSNKSFLAPCPFVRGNRYAKATLVISTGTMPTLWGLTGVGAGELITAPRLCGQVTGQTDLPESIAAASIVNSLSAFLWGRFA